MQPATEGIFALLRGVTFLVVVILGVFAAVLQFDAKDPYPAGAAVEAAGNTVDKRDVARRDYCPLVRVTHGSDLCCCDGNATTARSDFVSEEFDIARDGGWLIIPVTIDGTDYPFLVDTGCPKCIVDQELQSYLAPTGRTGDMGSLEGWPLCRLCKAHLGKSELPMNADAVCADLSWLRKVSHCKFNGILGMTFLKEFVVHIDFGAGKLSIQKSGPDSPEGALKLAGDSEHPTVGVEIWPGKTDEFLVDTGFCKGVVKVDTGTMQTLLRENRLDMFAEEYQATTFYGPVSARLGTIDRLRVAHFENTCLKVAEGSQNMLGLGYLSQFDVTFDFPKKILSLKRANREGGKFQFDMSGLWTARVDDKTIVSGVRAGSPAHTAGLQVGDQILRFGKSAGSRFGLPTLNGRLSKKGRSINLIVQRDNVFRAVKFQLADWQKKPADDAPSEFVTTPGDIALTSGNSEEAAGTGVHAIPSAPGTADAIADDLRLGDKIARVIVDAVSGVNPAPDIDLEIQDRTVTLIGSVPSAKLWTAIGVSVAAVEGIARVVNQLKIDAQPQRTTAQATGAVNDRQEAGDPTKSVTRRSWNPTNRKGIGIERKLQIGISSRNIVVGSETGIVDIGDGELTQSKIDDIFDGIDGAVQKWGDPPTNFYWLPLIVLEVQSGGEQTCETLRRLLLDEFGVVSEVRIAADVPDGKLSGGANEVRPIEDPARPQESTQKK